MKIKLSESRFSVNLTLTPENMDEIAKLFRMTKHSKRQTPSIHLSFSEHNTDGIPYCSITLQKKEPNNQVSHTSNRDK